MPDSDWFDGFESPGVPAWSATELTGTDLILTSDPQRIERGRLALVTVRSAGLTYLGRTATLTVSDGTLATASYYTAIMEPDGLDGVIALFKVLGVALGDTVLSVEVV